MCLCILLLSVACATAQFEPSNETQRTNQGTILSFSDIHFNPFTDSAIVPELIQSSPENWAEIFAQSADTHISSYGEETNYRLLVSALQRKA